MFAAEARGEVEIILGKRNHHKLRTFVCDYCGREFQARRERNGRTITCSMLCRNRLQGLRQKGIYPKQLEKFKGNIAGWNKGISPREETRRKISDSLRESYFQRIRIATVAPKKAYRKYALIWNENRCARCGWDKVKEVLMVHHIDGNRENNQKSNLLVLCPNCHFELHKWWRSNIERRVGNVSIS